jgi:hypothetical protein
LAAVRNASVTVQQAFAMWNSAFSARQSEHLAERLAREAPTLDAQISRLFALALNRDAHLDEAAEFRVFAEKHGLVNACRVIFNSSEFLFAN